MKMFSITGWSGSGKTTLITRLIEHLTAKGKRVAAVKSAPQKYDVEPEGKDTFKFLNAGAQPVYLAAKNELLTMRKITNSEDTFAVLEQEITAHNTDYLLLEGLRRDDIPMIEVFNHSLNDSPKFDLDRLAAIVTHQPYTDKIPNFNINNIDEITTFMEAYHE